ncbi:MAG: PilN domain-containing protein [Nitrospiraceae bacterium]
MIRINLIAGPRPKKAQASRQLDLRVEGLIGLAVLLLTLFGCWMYVSSLQDEREAKQREKTDKDMQVAALKEKVKQVQDFEQKKKVLEDKNRIIDQLERARGGPVKVLDQVSRSLDPLKLWLLKLNLNNTTVEVEGRALTNDDIVEFVNNLRRTDAFNSIQLIESRASTENKINLYSFKLKFALKA